MHILIVNFQLQDLSQEVFESVGLEVAPAYAEIPGMISKTFISNEETNMHGGVYVFESEQALLDFQASELGSGVESNEHFINVQARDFRVLEAPSKITRGL